MKKPLIISIICVAVTFFLLLWGFQAGGGSSPETFENYALVIQNDTGTFVMQLQKGMQQAAEELGVHTTVCTPSELKQLETLSGAVLWLDDPSDILAQLKAQGVPAAVVGQTLDDTVCVAGDDINAGKQLMLYALSCPGDSPIVLLTDDEDAHAVARSRSALQWGASRRVKVMKYQADVTLPEGCSVAITPSLRSTLAIKARKQQGDYDGLIAGVDTGDSRISDLESGLIAAMALNSPYAMGYLALYKARELAAGGMPDNAYAKVLLATPSNMYLSENVKQLFPLLH